MNLAFWRQVSESWLSIQQNAEETAVDLTRFRDVLLKDILAVRDDNDTPNAPLELDADDDFWGGL